MPRKHLNLMTLRKMIMDFSIPKNIRMIHLYLDKHLSEIEEKYGYVKEQY